MNLTNEDYLIIRGSLQKLITFLTNESNSFKAILLNPNDYEWEVMNFSEEAKQKRMQQLTASYNHYNYKINELKKVLDKVPNITVLDCQQLFDFEFKATPITLGG